jgi:hypothetical protein
LHNIDNSDVPANDARHRNAALQTTAEESRHNRFALTCAVPTNNAANRRQTSATAPHKHSQSPRNSTKNTKATLVANKNQQPHRCEPKIDATPRATEKKNLHNQKFILARANKHNKPRQQYLFLKTNTQTYPIAILAVFRYKFNDSVS